MARGNIDNLKPIPFKEDDERTKEAGRKGGLKKGENAKKKRLIKDNIELLLSLPIKSEKTQKQLKELGIDEDEMNNQMALVIAMYQKALKGDVNAFNSLRDTIGQKPIENYNITETPKILDDID